MTYVRKRLLLLTAALAVSIAAIVASLHSDGVVRGILVVVGAAAVPAAGLAQSVIRALRERTGPSP